MKLADFGLAREETVTEMMTAETGTYRWMAPEVCCCQFVFCSLVHPLSICMLLLAQILLLEKDKKIPLVQVILQISIFRPCRLHV